MGRGDIGHWSVFGDQVELPDPFIPLDVAATQSNEVPGWIGRPRNDLMVPSAAAASFEPAHANRSWIASDDLSSQCPAPFDRVRPAHGRLIRPG